MAVNQTGRYFEAYRNGRYIALPKNSQSLRFRTYMAKGGESFDHLAHQLYGDSQSYWSIADLNPHVPFPDTIPAGTEIRLPL